MKKTRKYLLCLQVACSKLLQLSKSWSNFISDRRIIWRLLSTHYLTQRQKKRKVCRLCLLHISTHYLTQRQTDPLGIFILFVIFQLTTSRRGRPEASNAAATLEIFQLTTSRRGRPECGIRIFYQYSYFNSLPHAEVDKMSGIFTTISNISTHYLTQRQTVFEDVDMTDDVFQLTTSRRGRQTIKT